MQQKFLLLIFYIESNTKPKLVPVTLTNFKNSRTLMKNSHKRYELTVTISTYLLHAITTNYDELQIPDRRLVNWYSLWSIPLMLSALDGLLNGWTSAFSDKTLTTFNNVLYRSSYSNNKN